MIKNKNKILVIVLLVALIGIGLVYVSYTQFNKTGSLPSNPEELSTIDYGPSKSGDKLQPSSKDEIINGSSKEDSSNRSMPSDIKVTITQATQRDNIVYIRAFIDGSLEGMCEANFENSSNKFSKQAPYSTQASYVICQGFNIPLNDFAVDGTWKVTLTATSKEGKKALATTTVEVKK